MWVRWRSIRIRIMLLRLYSFPVRFEMLHTTEEGIRARWHILCKSYFIASNNPMPLSCVHALAARSGVWPKCRLEKLQRLRVAIAAWGWRFSQTRQGVMVWLASPRWWACLQGFIQRFEQARKPMSIRFRLLLPLSNKTLHLMEIRYPVRSVDGLISGYEAWAWSDATGTRRKTDAGSGVEGKSQWGFK